MNSKLGAGVENIPNPEKGIIWFLMILFGLSIGGFLAMFSLAFLDSLFLIIVLFLLGSIMIFLSLYYFIREGIDSYKRTIENNLKNAKESDSVSVYYRKKLWFEKINWLGVGEDPTDDDINSVDGGPPSEAYDSDGD